MTSPDHTGGRGDLSIAARAGQVVQSYPAHSTGESARTAHAWIDSLHNRAHRAAERHRRRDPTR